MVQAGQLPPGLGLVGNDLENAHVLLRGFAPVARLHVRAREAETGLKIARGLRIGLPRRAPRPITG